MHKIVKDQTKRTKKRGRLEPIIYSDFVKAWAVSKTVAEVGQRLGVSGPACSRIAYRLRKEGVRLKQFPRHQAQPINVQMLNKLLRG